MPRRSTIDPRDRGGPTNITGIYYQLLASFREATSAVQVLDYEEEGAELNSVILMIEPRGGGDNSVWRDGYRRVQQIKTSGKRWSFGQLTKRVFPDLFRAYLSDPGVAQVEFVTNGQLDKTSQAFYTMLGDLARRWSEEKTFPNGREYLVPWFKRRDSTGEATLDDLVDFLAGELQQTAVSHPLEGAGHRRAVEGFLVRLSIHAGQSFEAQEQRCREFLRDWGVIPGDGPIDQMVGLLLRKGRSGNQPVTFREIALELGLAPHPLSNWRFLSRTSRDRLLADLNRPRPGYDEAQDVRRSDPLLAEFSYLATESETDSANPSSSFGAPTTIQPIVLWGKSGIGKTWLLARAATRLARDTSTTGPALVWLSSHQDPRMDLEEAARKFCHQVWSLERQIPMELLAGRVRTIGGPASKPWLVVFIDDVRSKDYLDKLGECRHDELGIVLVIALTAQFGDDPPQHRGILLHRAPTFSKDEVLSFLERRTPSMKGLPPIDVRRLLETPVFCTLYATLKQGNSPWQPDDEYGLVQRFWLERIARPRPPAADVLARLCFGCLCRSSDSSENSPAIINGWTIAELTHAGLSQADLDAFEQLEILVRDAWSRSYSLGQERILQWAAAEGALRAFRAGQLQPDELVRICVSILIGESAARRQFGYVPADLLWLLLDPDLPESCRNASETILAELESHHDFIRLEDWLSTLGDRFVPVMFARLQSIDPSDSNALFTYRDALARIPSSQVAHLATRLLTEPILELQEVGILLLGRREHPPALDTLWNLYQEWWTAAHTERASGEGRREGPWLYHVDIGERALRRSVRNQPEWLENRLLDAAGLGGANSVLLFLLASTPMGEIIWKRHKILLKSRLQAGYERGFARCIIAFRDRDEIPWLKSKVNETGDLIAPAARKALALLSPDSALIEIDQSAEIDLAMARGWWLPLLRIQRPLETARFLSELIIRSKDPMRTIVVFNGLELWYPGEIVRFLLDSVRHALGTISRGEASPERDPLFAPLSHLSDCITLDHLGILWEPTYSGLESELADWLCKRGVNDKRFRRHGSEEEAGKVLSLIAGSGMAKVGRNFLAMASSWTGARDGLELAVRNPDPETLSTIRRRALDPCLTSLPSATEHPVLQRFCVTALAYLRDFEGFSRGVLQWGLQLPPDLMAYLDEFRQQPELLEFAKEALALDPMPPGALLLLGFHGGTEAIDLLRLQSSDRLGTADLKVAHLIGLDSSGDCCNETLDLFAQGLTSEDGQIQYCSSNALLHRADNSRVHSLLLASLDRGGGGSDRLANLLLEEESLRREVAGRLWQRPRDHQFLFHFSGQLDRLAVLATEEVRNFLLDQAMRDPQPMAQEARYSAIRGLVLFDRTVALRAALASQNGERHPSGDREWPHLLIEVGGADALPYLRTELAKDRDLVRLHAIGEALRAERQADILNTWLRDEDPKVREGACLAACAQPYDPRLEHEVNRCCLDPDEDVRDAAQSAFDNLSRDREVTRLIDCLRTEPQSGRRWALTDAALAIGYPGVRPGFGQVSWFSQLVADRPYYEARYASERLNEKRKKLIEDLERRSKKFREEA